MSNLGDYYFIKELLDRETALSHNGETGYYSVNANFFGSDWAFPESEYAYSFYNAMRAVFRFNYDYSSDSGFNNHESLNFFTFSGDDNLYYCFHNTPNIRGNLSNNQYYEVQFNPQQSSRNIYKYDITTNEISVYSTMSSGSSYKSVPVYKFLASTGSLYVWGTSTNTNYINIEGNSGNSSGGWQVPNPNPTRKIVVNGVVYSDDTTPEPVNIARHEFYNDSNATGTNGITEIISEASSDSTIDNFFLDLKKFRFAGSSQSQVWNCTTELLSYDGTEKKIKIKWGTQSGSAQECFDIVEVSDPTRVQVLRDWETITQGGTIEVNIPNGASITADDVILDFKNVYTYEWLNGGNINTITKSISNGKIVITIPDYFDTNSHFDLRVLAVIPRPSHTIKLNGATPKKIMLNGECYYEDTSGPTLLYDWDFTESLTDKVSGVTAVLAGASSDYPTRDSSGVHFTSKYHHIDMGPNPINMDGKTIEIDFGSISFSGSSSKHKMIIVNRMNYSDSTYGPGILQYWTNGGWTTRFNNENYNSTTWGSPQWGYNAISFDELSNSTLKVKVENHSIVSLWVGDDFKGTIDFTTQPSTSAVTNFGNSMYDYLTIGCPLNNNYWTSIYDAYITGVRIYENEE